MIRTRQERHRAHGPWASLSRRLEACYQWPDRREPDLCVDACACGPGPGGEIKLRHERLSERRQWGSIPAGAGRMNTPAGIQL